MQIHRLNDKQRKILEALGSYKFLTYSQMIRLGIDRHKSNLSVAVKSLIERRGQLVRKIPHRPGIETKFYLSSKGKEVLVNFLEWPEGEVHSPKGIVTTDTQDQKHRTSIISTHIEFDLFGKQNGTPLLWCERYFDTVGNNRISKNLKSKTAFIYEGKKSVKADMIFILKTSKQKELYIVELENGRDSKKAVQKFIDHGKALLLGSVNEKYRFKQGYRTLWIFEHASTMQAVLASLEGNPFFENMKEYFLCKPLSEILDGNLLDGWINLESQARQLYYL